MTSEHKDVVRRYYATDENLRIRQETHDKYTVPQRDFVQWALSCIQWRGDEKVLDVGAGPGTYFDKLNLSHPDVQYVGMDLMPSMLSRHEGKQKLAQGDVHKLPFADDTFDVVMANHMLYHSEDIPAALNEIRRVLKPDGLVMAATNSTQTMPELQVLLRRAIVLLTKSGATQVRPPSMPSDNFALENGTRLMSQVFFSVVRYDLPSALVFPDVEPAMSYLESTRDLRESQLPKDVVWDDVMMIMRQQIHQLIKHLGELVINKQSGILIGTQKGAHIARFLKIQAEVDSKSA
jgi:SAM-dependent methyltransferase